MISCQQRVYVVIQIVIFVGERMRERRRRMREEGRKLYWGGPMEWGRKEGEREGEGRGGRGKGRAEEGY